MGCNQTKSLIEYLLPSLDFNIENLLKYASGTTFNSLLKLTHEILIFDPPKYVSIALNQIPFPHKIIHMSTSLNHSDFINQLIEFMLDNNLPNSITLGFSCRTQGTNKEKYFQRGYNESVNLLKSLEFEVIKSILGCKKFVELIIYRCASINNCLIWGFIKLKSFTNVNLNSMVIKMNGILFNFIKQKNPIGGDWSKLISNILPDYFSIPAEFNFNNPQRSIFVQKKIKNLPKRFRPLASLLKLLIAKHKSFEDKYTYVFDSICSSDNKSMIIPKDKIFKFIATVVYKVIPYELFGTIENRKIILSLIPRFLTLGQYKTISFNDALKNVKITQINWVKPRDLSGKMSKADFLKAQKMFFNFIKWLFQSFISKLLASFLHLTQPSQKLNSLIYIPRIIWKRLVKRFKSKYFNKYLKFQMDNNNYNSFINNFTHLGKLKLLPKIPSKKIKNNNKCDFRLIVKPFRGSQSERSAYLTYRKMYIKPINAILKGLQTTQSCKSVDEVITRILKFKKQLKNTNDTVYAIKFDIKEAYDSLPHDIIEKIISKKLDKFTQMDSIYVQYHHLLDVNLNIQKPKLVVCDKLSKLSMCFHNSKLYPGSVNDSSRDKKRNRDYLTVDKHETLAFTKKKILEIIRTQYAHTSFKTQNKKSYIRTVGVFQGFPLSGIIFNLVYDDVVKSIEKHISENVKSSPLHFTIIRLVDDFLILSTNTKVINIIRKLTARQLLPFNAKINRLKSEISKDKIKFVGINIYLNEITCIKDYNQYNTSAIKCLSFPKLYKLLFKYFQSRLSSSSNTLFNMNVTDVNGIRRNVWGLIKALVWKFVNSFTHTVGIFYKEMLWNWLWSLYKKLSKVLNIVKVLKFTDILKWSTSILKQKRIL